MIMLIEVLAQQKAQSEGRNKTCKDDFIWAQQNMVLFERQQQQLGLGLSTNEIVFDDELNLNNRD